MYRQGDVLLIPCSEKEHEGEVVKPVNGKLVLAEGEATGHAHAIAAQYVEMRRKAAAITLLIVREVLLKHEEHGDIPVPSGNYRVVRQREYSPEEIRNVAD